MKKLSVVDRTDMWVLLVSTVRYSMGRRTYMSSLAGELVIKYRDYLTKQQLIQIVEEIRKELRSAESFGSYLGSKIDHESWTSTANIIENLMKDRHI